MTATMPGATAPGARRTRRTPATTGLTAQQLASAKGLSEDGLLLCVIDLCHLHGLLVAHFRPAGIRFDASGRRKFVTPVQGDGKGYPDTIIVGGRWPLWRELKSHTGRLSPEQIVWGERITASGGDFGVWEPIDWVSGRIAREIRAVAS